MEKFFGLKEHGTTVKTEVMAGLATFMTMAYILAVNPQTITGQFGGPMWNAVFMATALSAFVGTLLMALYAKMPFAQAPGMGLNAFFATVVAGLVATQGISEETAYAAGFALVMFSGVLFTLLTLFKVREKIVKAIPKAVRLGIPAGIGLMLAFVGLKTAVYTDTGAVTIFDFFTNGPSATIASMTSADYSALILNVIVALIGLFVIAILHQKKVKGSVLFGIVISTVIYWIGSFILGNNPFASLATASFIPPFGDMFNLTFCKFDISAILNMGVVSAVMTVVSFAMVDMFDTIGTLLGTAKASGMLDENDELPGMNKAMLCDSVATMAGAALGTSTVTTFVESAAGVEEGGRTGLTSLVTSLLFLVSIFLAPVFGLIPGAATAPALVFVGILMLRSIKDVDFTDMTALVPVVLMLIIIPVTSKIGDGIGFGLISYTILKIFSGKVKDVSILTAVLSVLFLVKFFLPF